MGLLRKIFGESFKELISQELENKQKIAESELLKEQQLERDRLEIINKRKLYEEQMHNKKVKQIQAFSEMLSNLSICKIEQSNIEHARNHVSLTPEIKFSNITLKTVPENLSCYVVIDTETTGLKASDSIIELSAIRFEDYIPIEYFSSLIKPKKEIPEEIIKLTGITNEMVANAPTFSSVVDSFIRFISKSNLVGHNLGYDLKMLWSNGANIFELKRKYFDTLDIAQKTLKKIKQKWNKEIGIYEGDYESDYDVDDYKLDTICDYYEIYRDNSHRSLSDALATGLIFKKLVDARTIKKEVV